MKNGVLSVLICLFLCVGFTDDETSYHNGQGFVKTRQVADLVTSSSFTVGATAVYLSLPKTCMSVTVSNTHASNTLYVNVSGGVPLNVNNGGATTTAGSNIIDLNATVTNEYGETVDLGVYLPIGSLIVLDEGDANDGIYSITAKVQGNRVRLNRNLAVTSNATQDYVIHSVKIAPETAKTITVGSKKLSFVATGASTTLEIDLSYQKDS